MRPIDGKVRLGYNSTIANLMISQNSFLLVMIGLLFFVAVQTDIAQSTNRIVRAEISDNVDEEAPPYLQIISIKIGVNPIRLNETFSGSDDWLENMKIQVKNISKKNLSCVILSVNLLRHVDEILPPNASWQYGLPFAAGDCGGKGHFQSTKLGLKPGQELELDFTRVPELTRRIVETDNVGAFQKAILWKGSVKFKGSPVINTDLKLPPDTLFSSDPPY